MVGQDAAHRGRAAATPSKNPKTRWSLPIASEDVRYAPTPVVAADGTIYVVVNRTLVAVTPAGTQAWAIGTDIVQTSPAIGPTGSIYVLADHPAVLRAYDASGSQSWSVALAGEDVLPDIAERGGGGPVVVADGTIYVAGMYDLHAVSPAGEVLWSIKRSAAEDPNVNEQIPTPAVGPDGVVEVLSNFVGSPGWNLMAVSPAGSVLWQQPLGDAPHDPVIADDGTSYVSFTNVNNAHCYVQAFSPDGTPTWNAPMAPPPSGIDGLSWAVATDGTLYVLERASLLSSASPALAAFHPDGTSLWTQPVMLPAQGQLTQPAIGTDGSIGVVGGGLTFTAPDGQPAGSYTASGAIYGQAIGADGTIYVIQDGSALVALGN
jgi:hypothetical protein